MLEIFHYSEPHIFLKDLWREKKRANPAFSLRSWARKMGLKSNAPLTEMLQGKRPIPKRYLPLFIDTLSLSSQEGFFLETLLDFRREKDPRAKKFYLDRLRSLSPRLKNKKSVEMFEVESFQYLGNPLATIILEMTELKGFSEDPKWIQSRLRLDAKQDEIKEILNLLLRLNLLERDSQGKLRKTHRHLTNKPDVVDRGSQEYHKNVCQLAAKAIESCPVQEREFNAYAINMKSTQISAAKTRIRKFIKEFASEFEASPKQGTTTLQLNIQLFPITKETL